MLGVTKFAPISSVTDISFLWQLFDFDDRDNFDHEHLGCDHDCCADDDGEDVNVDHNCKHVDADDDVKDVTADDLPSNVFAAEE